MVKAQPGFCERAHTADWELEAWAADLPGLLEQAARGLCSLAGLRLQAGPRQNRHVYLRADDTEHLLVRFLQELLYFSEVEGLGFDDYVIQLDGMTLQADLGGAALAGLDKQIKAVTYHNLVVRQEEGLLRVNIVLDV